MAVTRALNSFLLVYNDVKIEVCKDANQIYVYDTAWIQRIA